MKAFAYIDASNEQEALSVLGTERGKTLPLAGGMDILGLMKDYVLQPDQLVNVKNLDRAISNSAAGVSFGAAVRLIDIIEHADIARLYPALVYAALEVGTPQIRNAATLGGNINQRPRCWYFRNEEFSCLKKGGAECYAVNGENQYHAIFGEGPCHIVHPSALAVPIMALGGRFRVSGPSGEREVVADDFFVMPDRNMWAENILEPNELLTHVILPAEENQHNASYEVRFKQSHDWPLCLASVALTMEGDNVKSARVVMGAVAPVPWRSHSAEEVLVGQPITEELAARAAEAALSDAKPMSQNAYKIQIARTTVRRAILKAAGMLNS